MVSHQDPLSLVRALQLGMVLRCLIPGWNHINPHLFCNQNCAASACQQSCVPAMSYVATDNTCFQAGKSMNTVRPYLRFTITGG